MVTRCRKKKTKMNEETALKIAQEFEEYNKNFTATKVLMVILILVALALFTWELIRMVKLKKWKQEYLASLTDEQLKAIENYKKHLI